MNFIEKILQKDYNAYINMNNIIIFAPFYFGLKEK